MTIPIKPTDADRLLRAFRKLITSCMPQLVYWIAHEYTVIESDGTTFSGLPTDADFSPQLPTRVPYAPSLAGSQCVVPQGTLAHVVFVNADASKPRCVGFDLPSVPTSATVDASASLVLGPTSDQIRVGGSDNAVLVARADATVLRDGDTVSISPGNMSGPVTGVITITLGQGVPPAVSRLKA